MKVSTNHKIHTDNLKRYFSYLSIILILLIIYILTTNKTNNFEINYYINKTVKLLLSSKKCKSVFNETLYFTSNFRNKSIENSLYYKIVKKKIKINSIMTYYSDDYKYNQYEELLTRNGLVKNYNINSNNNLFLSKTSMDIISKNKTNMRINILNKYYRFFGYKVLRKDSLYMNYMQMKSHFNSEFNFMPETYIYPNDKEIIYKKFKNYELNISNLWLVKPPHKHGGKGIRIFETLNHLTNNSFLITKNQIKY